MQASNPFATKYVRPQDGLFILSNGESFSELVERIRTERVGQIIGPHGSGKSTLLESLKPLLLAAGWKLIHHSLREGERRLPTGGAEDSEWGSRTLVIIDGFEQIPRCRRWALIRRARNRGCGLLVTCHADVGLPIIFRTRVDRELVREVVAQLTENAGHRIDAATIDRAFDRHGANVREVLFELYDIWNETSSIGRKGDDHPT